MKNGNMAQQDLMNDREPNDITEKIKNFLFGEKTPAAIVALVVVFIIVMAMMLYCVGFFLNIYDSFGTNNSIMDVLNYPVWKHYAAAVFTPKGWLFSFALAGIIIGLLWVMSRRNTELSSIKGTDDRDVAFSEKGTYGTAEWMSEKEAKTVYEVTDIDHARGVILGQFSENGKKIIAIPEDTKDNRNILILGSPGTGKSWCFVRNAIFQAMVRGESCVITDPKGELYEDTSNKFRELGYVVKVFNLNEVRRSDAWNCVSEIYDPETGDVDELRVQEFVDVFMKNTSEGPSTDFWGSGESNLMTAIIMYCAWNREKNLQDTYLAEGRDILKRVGSKLEEEDRKRLFDTLAGNLVHVSMNDRRQALRILLMLDLDNDEAAIDEYLAKIEREAPLCNIGALYRLLSTSDIKELEGKFAAIPPSHPAAIAWAFFKTASDNVRPGLIQGLGQRLQLFQSRDLRRITTNDDIHFEDISKEKTVLFCCTSDKKQSMKPISSLMFTFLFKDLMDVADRYGPSKRIPVNFLCDEFANIGIIPGFSEIISTARSRKINISIILQSIKQLEQNYEKSQQTIISCCDTVLFLGCNDIDTADFISDLSGTASIRVVSSRDSRNTSFGNRGLMQGYAVSEGDGKRMLMNPDEVRRLGREKVLIYHRGYNLLEANRCGYTEHKFYRDGMPPKVKLVEYPLSSDKYAITEDIDAFIMADIYNMRYRNQRILENEKARQARESYTSYAAAEKPDEPEDPQISMDTKPLPGQESVFRL